MTHGALQEGALELAASYEGGRTGVASARREFAQVGQHLWGILRQPVWVPGRKNTVTQHSRGVLFLLDTLRFGGTFAGIFLALFVTMNYQSFWEITKAKLTFLEQPSIGSGMDPAIADILRENLKNVPELTKAGGRSDLLSYLKVGPPIPRLIIPKLSLNVPIVLPPTDALRQQDWGQVERDIQHALQDGVVHYPGTARPGQAGNFFITGHSSYYPFAAGHFKTVFARLHELQPGDEYWVYFGGDKHRYVIDTKKEVKPSDISVLDQPLDQRIATLMTCTPVGTTLRRLIVRAHEIDPITGEVLKVGERIARPEVQELKLEALPI